MISRALAFLKAIWAVWNNLLTGGSIAALVLLVATYFTDLPRWVGWLFPPVVFVLAVFRVWEKQNETQAMLQAEIAKLADTESEKRRKGKLRDDTSELWARGVFLLHRWDGGDRYQVHTTTDEFIAWFNKAVEFLNSKVSSADADYFAADKRNMPNVYDTHPMPRIQTKREFELHLKNLRDILDQMKLDS